MAFGYGTFNQADKPFVIREAFTDPAYANRIPGFYQNAGIYGSREDTSPFRQKQLDYVNELERQASGEGPSVAREQLKTAMDQNVRQGMGLYASTQGRGNSGLIQKQIADQTAQTGQQYARDASTLRAQEMIAARDQLANAIATGRGQDMAFQQMNDQLMQYYTSLGFSAEMAQAQSTQDLNMFEANMQMDWNNLLFAADEARRQRELESKKLAANIITSLISGIETKQNIAPIGSESHPVEPKMIDEPNALQKFGQGLGQMYFAKNANTPIGSTLGSRSIGGETSYFDMAKRRVQGYRPVFGDPREQVPNYPGQPMPSGSGGGGITGGIAAGAAFSDRRAKTNVSQIGAPAEPQMEQSGGFLANLGSVFSDEKGKKSTENPKDKLSNFLDSMQPFEYDYKDPMRHGDGKHYGVMAQDMEQSEIGKSIVMETPEGKALDGKKLLSALTAATTDLHNRLKALEGR